MILFANARIFDGSGAAPFSGEVLVKDNRIASVSRSGEKPLPRANATVVDCAGATLMPGLTEAHAHLSWPSSVEQFVPGMSLPPDELVRTTARNARILLDHGFTSAYSGGALGKTLEVTLKAQIDSGELPGPRLIPSSIEREPPTDQQALNPGSIADHGKGPQAIREFVKSCAAIGAKSVKFLLSGESALKPGASMQLLYTPEEVQAAGEQARESNVWLTGHAHAAEAVKLGARNGFRILYHCTYSDQEAIDLLTARKHDIFVAPTVGIVQATLDATPPPQFDMSHMKADATVVLEHQKKLMPELKRRGLRILPGGDYGFPFNPNGRNARDLELFVRHFGFSPTEALVAATKLGGELMGMGDELGQIKIGYLADLLLVNGDPTANVAILQDKSNLLAIMKDGKFHKSPSSNRL
ncbi:MAG TPA: amidohydrolase family protein [Steroidobacteraceae bacterium]|nr:amidohydrolase family protein [Steroidobacteraceae bacterium]